MAAGFIFLQAQEPKPPAKPSAADAQLRQARPGPEHERLAKYTGTWNLEVKMGAGAAAMVYKGASTNRMTVGGRFLQLEYHGSSPNGNTEGIFTLGFDPRHQHYTLIAMDSFGPYFVTSKGKHDDKSGKIRLLGSDDDPAMKAMGFTKEFVHTLDLGHPDELAIEVWFIDTRTPARREMKFMTYTFKRQ